MFNVLIAVVTAAVLLRVGVGVLRARHGTAWKPWNSSRSTTDSTSETRVTHRLWRSLWENNTYVIYTSPHPEMARKPWHWVSGTGSP